MKTIKELYQAKFPEDELGGEIDPSVTIWDVITNIEHVYGVLNVHDSLVRERVFELICEVVGCTYEQIYDMWLESE